MLVKHSIFYHYSNRTSYTTAAGLILGAFYSVARFAIILNVKVRPFYSSSINVIGNSSGGKIPAQGRQKVSVSQGAEKCACINPRMCLWPRQQSSQTLTSIYIDIHNCEEAVFAVKASTSAFPLKNLFKDTVINGKSNLIFSLVRQQAPSTRRMFW